MTYTATTIPTMIDQHARNQMSLMAWVMAFLCGWVMFLSVHVIGAENKSSGETTAAADAVTARQ
jgi:hypothetical protein